MTSQRKKYPIKSLTLNLGMFCVVAEGSASLARRSRVVRLQAGAFGGVE
jgi:hypothetical protein